MKTTMAAMPTDPAADPHLDLMRAVRLCHPGWDTLGRVTLSANTPADGLSWLAEVFHPVLQPCLDAAFHAASRGDTPAVVGQDLTLDAALPAAAAAASRRAGTTLLEKFPAPPGERLWSRFTRRVAEGSSPGHLAVILSVRAAAFHLPPRLLFASCVFLEARAGMPGHGPTSWMHLVETARPSTAAPHIRAA